MSYNKKAVLAANTAAIGLLLRLEKEQRTATEEEQKVLRSYQGFGGLKCILNRTDQPEDIRYWSKSEQDLFAPTCALKQLIYREAPSADMAKRYWESIKASVLTSFYTDTRIVNAIADSLEKTDVTFRTCLDPSLGMGAFAETLVPHVGRVDAFEKDLLTARIAQSLHPLGQSTIFVQQALFESIEERAEADKYDLIASNIPFGDFMVYDRAYNKGQDVIKKESTRTIHNYFFIKGLDSIREGGVLAFITSQGLLDAPRNEAFRRYLMENSKLISAIRLPRGMFSENAGTEVGSDLIVLQKQSGKKIGEGIEQQFVQTSAVPKGDGFSIAFNHNLLFEGAWNEISHRTIATERNLGTDPYGKPTWEYQFEGGIQEMADSLREQLSHDIEERFDRKLYHTGVAMSEEERQVEAEKKLRKLGVTAGLSGQKEKKEQPTPQEEKEANDAYNLMPKTIQKQLPKLYSTQKELVGDKTAYARYFFPMGAYTAYILEYDPKTRIGFGAVTMGYGWELGNMSLDEMQEVKVHGLGIERDLYFTPCKLHEIEELEDLVQGQFTKEKVQIEEAIAEEIKEEIKEDTKEQEEAETQEEQMTPQTDIAEIISEEPAPEGVPTLTLFHQYEEKAEKRPDVEAPREMNGQTVYFDDDHHPIVESNNDQEYLLFAPEEYTLWTQEVERVSAELKANPPRRQPLRRKQSQRQNHRQPQSLGKPRKAQFPSLRFLTLSMKTPR